MKHWIGPTSCWWLSAKIINRSLEIKYGSIPFGKLIEGVYLRRTSVPFRIKNSSNTLHAYLKVDWISTGFVNRQPRNMRPDVSSFYLSRPCWAVGYSLLCGDTFLMLMNIFTIQSSIAVSWISAHIHVTEKIHFFRPVPVYRTVFRQNAFTFFSTFLYACLHCRR